MRSSEPQFFTWGWSICRIFWDASCLPTLLFLPGWHMHKGNVSKSYTHGRSTGSKSKRTRLFRWTHVVALVHEEENLLTPATHGVLPTGHHIFTLLVFPRNHLKLNARVSHSMVSKWKRHNHTFELHHFAGRSVTMVTLKKDYAYRLRHSWRIWYGESSPALLVSSYTLESSILIWLKYCGEERTGSLRMHQQLTILGGGARGVRRLPPVHRPQQASPQRSASQSQGWGFPVWLELKFTINYQWEQTLQCVD